MKAILLEKAGGVENLHLENIPEPSITDQEVLVEVKAISLNPADVKPKYSDEMLTMVFGPDRPIILGWDIAGVVIATGKNVSRFKEGDRVFGMVNFPGKGNAYAEMVAAPASHLAKIPDNTTYEEAAATTLAALTALQILQGRIKQGDKVLVQGGSGGVGHFAIQITKAIGAYVITTASAKNRDFVLSIGADEHIDYRTQKFEEVLADLDFVLDIFGGEIAEKSLPVLRPGGTLFSTAMNVVPAELKAKSEELQVNLSAILVKSSGEGMKTLSTMLEEGWIKPNIYKTFPLENMREAHTEVEKGSTVGKIIVTV